MSVCAQPWHWESSCASNLGIENNGATVARVYGEGVTVGERRDLHDDGESRWKCGAAVATAVERLTGGELFQAEWSGHQGWWVTAGTIRVDVWVFGGVIAGCGSGVREGRATRGRSVKQSDRRARGLTHYAGCCVIPPPDGRALKRGGERQTRQWREANRSIVVVQRRYTVHHQLTVTLDNIIFLRSLQCKNINNQIAYLFSSPIFTHNIIFIYL